MWVGVYVGCLVGFESGGLVVWYGWERRVVEMNGVEVWKADERSRGWVGSTYTYFRWRYQQHCVTVSVAKARLFVSYQG